MGREFCEWTDEEIEKLRELVNKKLKASEIAEKMGRTPSSIYAQMTRHKIKSRVSKQQWSDEENNYLIESWGRLTLRSMALRLKRTEVAIKLQATKLGLGRATDQNINLKLEEFVDYSGISRSRVNYLTKNYDFPLIKKKLGRRKLYFVDIENVLKWMKKHQEEFDASKISEYLFVSEPEWLKEKRINDSKSKEGLKSAVVVKKWDANSITKLKDMISIGYSYEEIGKALGITSAQVARRAQKENFSYLAPKFWQGSDFRYLKEHWQTQSDAEIAKAIHKTKKSISKRRSALGLLRVGKKVKATEAELQYIKENLDKTDNDIGKVLGRSETSIQHIRAKFGLYKSKKVHKWTDSDKEYILNNLDKNNEEIASALGVSLDALRGFMYRSNIVKKSKI